MDLVGNPKKIFIFQRKLEDECFTYGWGRGLRCASQLYADNLNLEDENDILYYKMEKYKKKYEMLIDTEIKGIINDLTEKVVKDNESIKSNKYIVKIIKHEN